MQSVETSHSCAHCQDFWDTISYGNDPRQSSIHESQPADELLCSSYLQ
jgi:hypothetical protein